MKKPDNLLIALTLLLLALAIIGHAIQSSYVFGFSTLMLIIIFYVVTLSSNFNKK